MKGASLLKQNDWRRAPISQKRIRRILYKDSDNDGVPNKWDCRPLNPFKQDLELDVIKNQTMPNKMRFDGYYEIPEDFASEKFKQKYGPWPYIAWTSFDQGEKYHSSGMMSEEIFNKYYKKEGIYYKKQK